MANQDTDAQTELCISAYIELATVVRSNIVNSQTIRSHKLLSM